ncbi:MAG: outer membrane lipoprotein-sorting protein [Phycisphaerales bacterium]|nr:outer membrane lipoprotein-sorting protein [Phycisphaerales bacterium]
MKRRCCQVGMQGMMLVALAAVLAPAAAQDARPAEAAEKAKKAEQIIDKWIEAQGGRAALEKIKTRVTKAKFEVVGMGMTGQITTQEAQPHKQRVELDMAGMGKVLQGSDGELFWEVSMMGPRIVEGAERDFQKRLSGMHAELRWKDLYEKAEYAGEEDVEGQAAHKVVMTPKNGPAVTQYFDKDNYLLRKVELTAPTAMGDLPMTMRFEDYRRVNGLMIAHKVTQTLQNVQSMTLTLESVEHNVDLPADTFALPPEIVELQKAKAAGKDSNSDAETKPEAE